MRGFAFGVGALFILFSSAASAQQSPVVDGPGTAPPGAYPPQQPGPAYGYPPPGYGQPPYGNPNYGPYSAPPPAMQPPLELPYKDGDPIPVGYHMEERPRQGLITAGFITTGIPYAIGLMVATAVDFDNQSAWLAVPFAGPWLLLGRRDYHDCSRDNDDRDDAGCVGDVFSVMGLIMDGIVQAGGGTLLLIGYVATKKKLIRDDAAVSVLPRRVGHDGVGISVSGLF